MSGWSFIRRCSQEVTLAVGRIQLKKALQTQDTPFENICQMRGVRRDLRHYNNIPNNVREQVYAEGVSNSQS